MMPGWEHRPHLWIFAPPCSGSATGLLPSFSLLPPQHAQCSCHSSGGPTIYGSTENILLSCWSSCFFIFLRIQASLQASCIRVCNGLRPTQKMLKINHCSPWCNHIHGLMLLQLHLAHLPWQHLITVCTFCSLWAVHPQVLDICH